MHAVEIKTDTALVLLIKPMKTSLKIALATSALALGQFAPVLLAQNEPPPPPPPGDCPGGTCKNPQDGFLAMLTDKLSLTQAQQTKIMAILDDEKAAMDALRDSKVTDREAGHAKMEAILKSHREQIRALLSTEQQKIFDALKPAGRPGGPGHRGPDGPPPEDN